MAVNRWKFASVIKNIIFFFLFSYTPLCVSTVYSNTSPSSVKIITGMPHITQVGFEPTAFTQELVNIVIIIILINTPFLFVNPSCG